MQKELETKHTWKRKNRTSSCVPFHRTELHCCLCTYRLDKRKQFERLDITGISTHVTYLELTTSPVERTGHTDDDDDDDDGNFFHGATASSGPGPPHYRGLTITLRHTTLGRTPLDEWSACPTWQHTKLTRDRHPCTGGIRTHNRSKRATADQSLRPLFDPQPRVIFSPPTLNHIWWHGCERITPASEVRYVMSCQWSPHLTFN
jgi:hypothetical protein